MNNIVNAAASVVTAFGRFCSNWRLCSSVCVFFSQKLLTGAMNAHFYDMERNGEVWLVQNLAGTIGNRAVLDIGANHGAWSSAVQKCCPGARLYAVEMIPEFANEIRARLSGVSVIECALGEREDTVIAYQVGGGGRLVARETLKPIVPMTVTMRTGDSVVAELGIDDIALIKIDVDGYDVAVLRGLTETIVMHRPVIQFEYSSFYISTRSYLKDAYEFFAPLDYKVGRLMPRAVLFEEWSPRREVFLTNNFVAVPSEGQKVLAL